MSTTVARAQVPIERLAVTAFAVPTDAPESDGTLEWDSTTLVVVELEAGGVRGLGYTYADAAAAAIVERRLRECVVGCDAMDVPAAWQAMCAAVRNIGLAGVAAAAISAVDTAIWDLKARLLELPLVALLGEGARVGAGLRQRRLHLLFARAARRTARRLARGGHRRRQDQGWPPAG